MSQELGVEITWKSTGETEVIHGCARTKSSDETWTDLLQYLLVVTDHDVALRTVPAAQFPSYLNWPMYLFSHNSVTRNCKPTNFRPTSRSTGDIFIFKDMAKQNSFIINREK